MMTEMSKLILIVDDDAGLRRLMERELHRHGFATVAAGSGAEALAALRDCTPDLMVLDLKLQDIRGQQLIQQLSEQQTRVPFLVVTGQGDERVAVEMMKHGALDYLVKDGDMPAVLPAVIRRALRQVERDQKLAEAERALAREHAFTAAVLDTSGALVVVLDVAGRIIRFNRACESATGYRAAEVLGQLFQPLFVPQEDLGGVQVVFEQLVAGAFPNQHENRWRTRAGGARWISWSNTALLNPVGGVEYIISTGIDVTERKELEQRVLEISDRERRRIGQDLHDGLGQHLAATELMTQVLEQKLAHRQAAEAADVAEISRCIRDAITQSRLLARGLTPVTLESAGLTSALEELAAQSEQMFRVRCRFHTTAPLRVDDAAAGTHLFRIAQEAVSNAVKHGRATEISLHLHVSRSKTVLSITDNGSGFVPPAENTGLGLRIMRYRAGMIGADLRIEAASPHGTLVRCAFKTPI